MTPRPAATRRRDDRGAAVVAASSFVALLLMVAVGLAAAAGLVRAHRSAQAAADLAALAAARTLARGGDACAVGGEVAEANGARLTGCTVVGTEVRVQAAAPGPTGPWPTADLLAEARAGPAPP